MVSPAFPLVPHTLVITPAKESFHIEVDDRTAVTTVNVVERDGTRGSESVSSAGIARQRRRVALHPAETHASTMTDTVERASVSTARYAINAAHRVLVGFAVLLLLTVAVIATVSLLVHFLPAQAPTSAWKYAVSEQDLARNHKMGPVQSCCKSSMTNVDAIKLLSPRTQSLLREHAKALSVDEAKLANDLFQMMTRDGVYDAVFDARQEELIWHTKKG